MNCANCGNQIAAADLFCDACGTRVSAGPDEDLRPQDYSADQSPTVPPVNGRHLPPPQQSYRESSPQPPRPAQGLFKPGPPQAQPTPGFFSHATRIPPGARQWTNATRYLCAAAYLSPNFANTVIGELIASHRAVAPSRGIDLDPIIRHCLKARRMKLTRDVVLSILLLVGLVTAPYPLFFVLLVTFYCGYLPATQWERRSLGSKALVGLATVAAILIFSVLLAVAFFLFLLRYLLSAQGQDTRRLAADRRKRARVQQ